MHVLSRKVLSSAELETLRKSRNPPQRWLRPMEKCKQMRKHRFSFTIQSSSWRCTCSMIRLPSCHWASSAKNMVTPVSGPVVRSHIWPRMWKEFCVRQIKPFLLSSQDCPQAQSSSSSSTSFPQDSSNTSPSPARLRSDDAHNQHRETEAILKNKIYKMDNTHATRYRLRDLPEWLEEFTDNLEDTDVPAPANISRDSDSDRPAKVAARNHSIHAHFPKDRTCEICKKTTIARAPCRKRLVQTNLVTC